MPSQITPANAPRKRARKAKSLGEQLVALREEYLDALRELRAIEKDLRQAEQSLSLLHDTASVQLIAWRGEATSAMRQRLRYPLDERTHYQQHLLKEVGSNWQLHAALPGVRRRAVRQDRAKQLRDLRQMGADGKSVAETLRIVWDSVPKSESGTQ